jgi:PAS domain S-box-containing protein
MVMDEEVKIMDLIRDHPLGMNIKEIAGSVCMSRNSAAKYLEVLTATGHLEVRQIGNAKLYYLSNRVPVRNILKLTKEMIVILDRHMRIVQSSDSFTDFIGSAEEQVLGSRLSRLAVPVLSEKEESDLAVVLHGGPALTREIRLEKSGTPVYLATRFIPVVLDGGDPGVTGLFANITEQRQAQLALMEHERTLSAILRLSPTPTFLIDRNHKIVLWNRALEIMTKINAGDIIGKSFPWEAFYTEERPCLADILLDRDAARFEQLYGNEDRISHIPENTRETTEFFPALGTNGTWLRCTATVIRDSCKNPTGAIEMLNDVTGA